MSTATKPYVSPGAYLIGMERRRQVEVEGYTPEHDDDHAEDDLIEAAVCYALANRSDDPPFADDPHGIRWPWEREAWKPSDDPVINLMKAGALIAAEIERLRRQQFKAAKEEVRADDHYPVRVEDGSGLQQCGVCTAEWHDDRCARWCETSEPGHWCHDCRSYGVA